MLSELLSQQAYMYKMLSENANCGQHKSFSPANKATVSFSSSR